METVGGMEEVDVIIGKKPSIEVSRCCMNKASSMILVFLFMSSLEEVRDQLQDGIEIICEEISQVYL